MSFGECDDHRGQYINECVGCLSKELNLLKDKLKFAEIGKREALEQLDYVRQEYADHRELIRKTQEMTSKVIEKDCQ